MIHEFVFDVRELSGGILVEYSSSISSSVTGWKRVCYVIDWFEDELGYNSIGSCVKKTSTIVDVSLSGDGEMMIVNIEILE